MRILTGIDIPFHPFGGSPIICNDWYSDLPNDIEVKFLALKPTDELHKSWWTMKDVTFLKTEKTKTSSEYAYYLKNLYAEVLQIVKEFKPDVIHAQHLNFGLSRVFSDIDSKIPKLGICHGTDVQWAMNEQFFKQNLIYITNHMDKLLFPAENMAKDFFELYKKDKNHVINPHGIPDRYYVKDLVPPTFNGKRKLKVLYAGRLLPIKGAHIAVESLKYTKNMVALTIIGNEDESGYMQTLKSITKSNSIKDVSFKNQVPRDTLIKMFNEYDLIVFPSVAVEAFSLTTIEAQATGLPVVYARAGGISNAVGDSGLIIEPNTPQELANVFDNIFRNPSLLRQYQLKGYKNAIHFKMSKQRKALFEITENLIKEKAIS